MVIISFLFSLLHSLIVYRHLKVVIFIYWLWSYPVQSRKYILYTLMYLFSGKLGSLGSTNASLGLFQYSSQKQRWVVIRPSFQKLCERPCWIELAKGYVVLCLHNVTGRASGRSRLVRFQPWNTWSIPRVVTNVASLPREADRGGQGGPGPSYF